MDKWITPDVYLSMIRRWWPVAVVIAATICSVIMHYLILMYVMGTLGQSLYGVILAIAAYSMTILVAVKRLIRRQKRALSLLVILVLMAVVSVAVWIYIVIDEGEYGHYYGRLSDSSIGEKVPKHSNWHWQMDADCTPSIAANAIPDRPETTAIHVRPFPEFAEGDRDILLRHLATSPRWCLKKIDTQWLAQRRYYSNSDLCYAFDSDLLVRFPVPHVRLSASISIAANELPNEEGDIRYKSDNMTMADARVDGIYQTPAYQWGNSYNSMFVLAATGYYISIYEQGPNPARMYTQTEVDAVRAELVALQRSYMAHNRGFDPALMPSRAIRTGRPKMQIWPTVGWGGYYHVSAFINPGAPGHVYVKTYGASYNVPLSAHPSRGQEITGWSSDPQQLFYYQSEVCIDEGGRQYAYPVRFELWFKPDDTTMREYKLVERVYRIYGADAP